MSFITAILTSQLFGRSVGRRHIGTIDYQVFWVLWVLEILKQVQQHVVASGRVLFWRPLDLTHSVQFDGKGGFRWLLVTMAVRR
jgi:hypothetical protein